MLSARCVAVNHHLLPLEQLYQELSAPRARKKGDEKKKPTPPSTYATHRSRGGKRRRGEKKGANDTKKVRLKARQREEEEESNISPSLLHHPSLTVFTPPYLCLGPGGADTVSIPDPARQEESETLSLFLFSPSLNTFPGSSPPLLSTVSHYNFLREVRYLLSPLPLHRCVYLLWELSISASRLFFLPSPLLDNPSSSGGPPPSPRLVYWEAPLHLPIPHSPSCSPCFCPDPSCCISFSSTYSTFYSLFAFISSPLYRLYTFCLYFLIFSLFLLFFFSRFGTRRQSAPKHKHARARKQQLRHANASQNTYSLPHTHHHTIKRKSWSNSCCVSVCVSAS